MHARPFVAILAFPLSLVLSNAQAAPSKLPSVQPTHNPTPKAQPLPGPKPTSKALPVPKSIQPISDVSPRLSPRLAKALRAPRTLSNKQIAAIAAKFKIRTSPNDVLEATTLTVRRPYAGPGAYLNFPFPDAVHIDAYPDGLASVGSKGQLRRVRGTGPALEPLYSGEDVGRQYDPLNPAFPDDADVTIDGGYLEIHFVAAPDRDYVVSCRVSTANVRSRGRPSTRTYGARVVIGGTYSHMIRGLSPERGRVSLAIPRAARKRGIDLQLVGYGLAAALPGFGIHAETSTLRPFSVSRCEISPIE